jgi:hypothetical protein
LYVPIPILKLRLNTVIFLGDIASPHLVTTKQLETILRNNSKVFNGKRLICNLEGAISEEEHLGMNKPVLYNHPALPSILNRGITPVMCLANNHLLDLPGAFNSTIELFKKYDIIYCGAGRSKHDASKPATFVENQKKVFLFNACWNFLLYNQRNPSKGVHVAKINELKMIKEVKFTKESNNNALIIIFLHWSLDLETLPFPMYRQFAVNLIEAGANIVVGSHSHCLQGGEKYKEGFIVYSLGNFFIPYNTFACGGLTFPDFARIQLSFEWNHQSNEAICHWFEYRNESNVHYLNYLNSEKFEESVILGKYSPYFNMPNNVYLKYFKNHRRKKILIPIFRNYKRVFLNKWLTGFLMLRAHFARLLTKLKLRKWQN